MATPPPSSAPRRPGPSCPTVGPHQRRRRTRRILASQGVFDSIVSLAGLLGRPVRNQTGQEIGRLEDVVARWADGQVYPPVSGLVIRVGRRLAFVPASASTGSATREVMLRSSRLDLRDVVRRPERGPAGQGRARPPTGGRRRRPGHPGRRPLSGRGHRPNPSRRCRRLERDPAAPARPAPLAATPDARPRRSTGRRSSPSRSRAASDEAASADAPAHDQ